jgi:RHS repeat-associated protein
LIQISGTGVITTTWTYNALGDRSQETANQHTANYALDLNTGLTQVLAGDGQTYLYGLERLSQDTPNDTQYFLGDALGSVRQLVDQNGMINRVESYQPYGEAEVAYDNADTHYGFTGEWSDSHINLQYLRSRWYSTSQGRFLSRDTWQGDYIRPLSLNRWMYVEGNPINYVDPTGYLAQSQVQDAQLIVSQLSVQYGVIIVKDWQDGGLSCNWKAGEWTLDELTIVRDAIVNLATALNGEYSFRSRIGEITIEQKNISAPAWTLRPEGKTINVWTTGSFTKWTIVHELGHAWDFKKGGVLSKALVIYTGGKTQKVSNCDPDNALPGCNAANYYYKGMPPKGSDDNFNSEEDFAESVTAFVYPTDAANDVQKYNTNQYRQFLYYQDYKLTTRWKYVNGLVTGMLNPYKILVMGR